VAAAERNATSGGILYCDLALARRLERTEGTSNAEFVDARAQAYPDTGGTWIEVAGAVAAFDGEDSPCTQSFGLGLFEPVTQDHWTAVERFFWDRGADVFHEICPLADPAFLTQLSVRGYQPFEWSNVLVRPIDGDALTATARAAAVRARPIAADEHTRWSEVAAAGWSDVAPGLEDFLLGLGRINVHRANTHCFLAEKQGESIAAGAMYLGGGIALLAGAATIPRARRQGAQLALLSERLRFAADHGCELAMVVAQPGSASQRNAERNGFRVAYTRTKWRLGLGARAG
jgi:hypothetical protein